MRTRRTLPLSTNPSYRFPASKQEQTILTAFGLCPAAQCPRRGDYFIASKKSVIPTLAIVSPGLDHTSSGHRRHATLLSERLSLLQWKGEVIFPFLISLISLIKQTNKGILYFFISPLNLFSEVSFPIVKKVYMDNYWMFLHCSSLLCNCTKRIFFNLHNVIHYDKLLKIFTEIYLKLNI